MNRGTVQLDVVAKGQDEVSAMLRKVGDQAKATEKQLDGMADSTAKIGDQTGTNKLAAGFDKVDDAVQGAAQGVEKFNKILGIAGFIGGLAAAGTAVIQFARELLRIDDSAKIVVNSTYKINEALRDNIETFRKWRIEQAASEEQKTQLEIQNELADIAAERIKLTGERVKLESQLPKLIEQQRDLERQAAESKKVSVDNVLGMAAAEQSILEALLKRGDTQRAITEAQDALTRLKASEVDYTDRVNFLLGKQRDNMESVIAKAAEGLSVVRAFAQAMGIEVKPIEPAKAPKIPKASGGARPKGEEIISEIDAEIRIRDALAQARRDEYKDLVKLGEEKTRQRIEDDAAMESAMKALDIRLELAAIKPQVDGIMQAADAMQTFAAAIGDAAAAFPDLQSALDATMGTWTKYSQTVQALNQRVADGHMKEAEFTVAAEQAKTEAIIAGSTEGLAAIGKMIGGLKAEYALRAIGELAWGFATLSKPEESAGHFVAAGLYAVAAGTAIAAGGGGGARGGGAGTGAANDTGGTMATPTERREPRTIVYNFSTLIADRQQVHRAIRDSELVAERNGYGRRRGV